MNEAQQSFHDAVRSLAEKAAAKFPLDIAKATEVVANKMRSLDGYEEFRYQFERNYAQSMIHAVRCVNNRCIKRESGYYGGPAKVNVGNSETIGRIQMSVFHYSIAGKTLGELLFAELDQVESDEREKAAGHTALAELIAWIKKKRGRAEQRVADVVTEEEVQRCFKRINRKLGRDEDELGRAA